MMVKKAICIMMCISVLSVVTGCSGDDQKSVKSNTSAGVEDVLQQRMDESDDADKTKVETPVSIDEENLRKSGLNEGAPTPEVEEITENPSTEKEVAASSQDGIDIDLTALSSTMVYSEVYNMMAIPEDYIGKTVKMDGIFSSFCDETTGKYYFACIIMDATACCSQGIEFELDGEHKYPDDYPEVGEEVCVVGTFDTYKEGEYTYCTLRNARML